MDNLISSLSKINVNDEKTTVYNFIQGEIGNCGMISSISLLANNKDLLNKVVPTGQNFDSKNSTHVVFNLYKLGKLYRVEVSKTLPTKDNRLISCRSYNDNLVGPLLEKALVKLHFDGNYELAKNVRAPFVMTSLTNNFFEEFYLFANKDYHDIDKLISHGLETKSQMAVAFEDERASKLNLINNHYYSILNVEKSKDNLVKLYNPHGKILSIPKNDFEKTEKKLEICYSENKIFGIPEIKTLIEFKDNWPLLNKENENKHFVDYDLLIEEDKTTILLNIIVKKFSSDMKPIIIIDKINNKFEFISSSLVVYKFDNIDTVYRKYSLSDNLNRGKYKIAVYISSLYNGTLESCEECRKYLENGGSEFLFRLAASKQCKVAKSLKKRTNEIEKVLLDWPADLY